TDALFNRSMDHDRRRGRADGLAHHGVRADSDAADLAPADHAAAAGAATPDDPAADDAAAHDTAADDASAKCPATGDAAADRDPNGAAGRTGRSGRGEAAPHRGARVARPVDIDARGREAPGRLTYAGLA